MGTEEVVFPQDINLNIKIGVEVDSNKVASITIPKQLRITEEVFILISQLLHEQGFTLGNMNIDSSHIEEVKSLPNVSLMEKKE